MKVKIAFLPLFLVPLFGTGAVRGQANDNPTGPAGIFNGNIITGCSYDPYTGNATRRVTDITVAGAVGDYPLAFTRIANSRNTAGGAFRGTGLADAGLWRHSYHWKLNQTPGTYPVSNSLPTSYTVDYPDGRQLTFTPAPADSPAKLAGETLWRAAIGISERFIPLNLSTNLAYLVCADGGKVEFLATQYFNGTNYYRLYKAQAIIDPHGLRTALTYDASGRLSTITEPAGRWLQLTWIAYSNGGLIWDLISQVSGSDGRVVTYSYSSSAFPPGTLLYPHLDSVSYYNDSTIPNAAYTYKASNVPDSNGHYDGPPLLATGDDPMYAGPMKKIAYDYVPNAAGVVAGQILREKSGSDSVSVSSVATGGNGIDLTRTETRGDGPSRTITYRTWPYVGHLLLAYNGFVVGDPGSALGYDSSNYLSYFEDANDAGTYLTHEPIAGRLTSLTHPPDKNGVQSTVYYDYTDPLNPYYLYHKTDERSKVTTYIHDPSSHLVTEIDYPDGGYETFSYNTFHQPLSHRLTNGGIEYWTYDGRGLKQTYQAPGLAANKLVHYYYDSLDRLTGVKDQLGFQTDYEYNLRGEVTKITHPPDAVTGLRYYATNHYNAYGALDIVTDELGHVTVYDRDWYERITQVTNHLNQKTVNNYVPWGQDKQLYHNVRLHLLRDNAER